MSMPFRRLSGIAAPLPLANVDTDMILPAAFLKTVSRKGLGKGLFYNQRFDADGNERHDFVLNRTPWRAARILVTRDNFGCGSSREHAPWALQDFGISCILAPSFADIFHGNCFKNGMLPIPLPHAHIDRLLDDAADPARAMLTVDLDAQKITRSDATELPFQIDPQRRTRLLSGQDDIAMALQFEDAIAWHETNTRLQTPWLARSVEA